MKQKGFNLVELIATMALFGLVILLLHPLLDKKQNITERLENHFQALQIARSELETIRSFPVSSLFEGTSASLSAVNRAKLRQLPDGTATVQIQPFESGLKKVKITVRWKNTRQQPVEVKLVTLVGRQ